jgi:hypothetical protein
MPKRITLRLRADLLNRAHRKAAAQGCTVASLVEDGLRLVLAGRNRAGHGPRVMPRISTADGGLMPGIDLTDSAALQEMDDIDRAS